MKMPQFSKPSFGPQIPRFPLRRLTTSPLFRILVLAVLARPVFADDTIKSKVVDDGNHSVTETISDSHGKLQKKTVLFFATNDWFAKDNPSTGAVHYNTDNTIRYKETFLRDPKGVMQQTWLYSKDDKILGHRVFHYEVTGKLEHIDDFDANGQILAPRAAPVSPSRPDKKKR
jgi:hypothetical protein